MANSEGDKLIPSIGNNAGAPPGAATDDMDQSNSEDTPSTEQMSEAINNMDFVTLKKHVSEMANRAQIMAIKKENPEELNRARAHICKLYQLMENLAKETQRGIFAYKISTNNTIVVHDGDSSAPPSPPPAAQDGGVKVNVTNPITNNVVNTVNNDVDNVMPSTSGLTAASNVNNVNISVNSGSVQSKRNNLKNIFEASFKKATTKQSDFINFARDPHSQRVNSNKNAKSKAGKAKHQGLTKRPKMIEVINSKKTKIAETQGTMYQNVNGVIKTSTNEATPSSSREPPTGPLGGVQQKTPNPNNKVGTEEVVNANSTPTRKDRIPPIHVATTDDWPLLINYLQLQAPSLKSSNNGKFIKLNVGTPEEFRGCVNHLKAQGAAFKAFSLNEEKPIRLVLRGLPVQTDINTINEHLAAHGFHVVKNSRMSRWGSKIPLPLYYIHIRPDLGWEKIYGVSELMGLEVKFDAYIPRKGPKQCHSCQGFNHSSEACHMPKRCVKCSGPHDGKGCKSDFLKCCNCGGDHCASWRSCPRFPKASRSNPKSKTPQPKKQNAFIPAKAKPLIQPGGNNVKSFADVTRTTEAMSNLNIDAVTSIPNPPAPQGQTNKDFKFDMAGTLASLIDLSCNVDKKVLLAAFKNAIPKLRVAPSQIDVTYIILESYMALVD